MINTHLKKQPFISMGRGGGQVVSVLAFYSNDPSSNAAEAYILSLKFVYEKNENEQKEDGVGPFKKKLFILMHCVAYCVGLLIDLLIVRDPWVIQKIQLLNFNGLG